MRLPARYAEGEGRPSLLSAHVATRPRQRFYILLCLAYGADPVCYGTPEPVHRGSNRPNRTSRNTRNGSTCLMWAAFPQPPLWLRSRP